MGEERVYRRGMGLSPKKRNFEILEFETDLWISLESSAWHQGLEGEIRGLVVMLRETLKEYIKSDPMFLTSYEPWEVLPGAPPIAVDMAKAATKAGVGPMAAVAGAFARYVGRWIREITGSSHVLVENGGDIYIYGHRPITVSVHAGASPLSDKVGVRLAPEGELGICTSSGVVGHAVSFGKADACAVICDDVVDADAFATAFGNRVKSAEDIQEVLNLAKGMADIKGILIIVGDAMGAWGEIELIGL